MVKYLLVKKCRKICINGIMSLQNKWLYHKQISWVTNWPRIVGNEADFSHFMICHDDISCYKMNDFVTMNHDMSWNVTKYHDMSWNATMLNWRIFHFHLGLLSSKCHKMSWNIFLQHGDIWWHFKMHAHSQSDSGKYILWHARLTLP